MEIGLSLALSETPKTGFVASRPKGATTFFHFFLISEHEERSGSVLCA